MRASPLSPPRRTGSVRRRLAAIGAAALLAIGYTPAAAQAVQTPGERAADRQTAGPGTALAWGLNDLGQLGDGATSLKATAPVRVCGAAPCSSPLDQVVAVDGDGVHSIALRADGTVWTWGYNGYGQLGNGTFNNSTTPVQVCAVGASAPCGSFLTGVMAISAGIHYNLALRADGSLVAWGDNTYGQLGDGTDGNMRTVPVVTNLIDVIDMAAGYRHGLAVLTDGTVRSWGSNAEGELGDGTTTSSDFPVQVCAPGQTAPCSSFLDGVTRVSAGAFHSLALEADGTVRSWGENSSGQLGDGTATGRIVPVQVSGLTGVKSISAGGSHSLAARTDGTVRSWGYNAEGELGDGTHASKSTPVQVCAPGTSAPCSSFLTGIATVSGGFQHSLALRTDGTVRSWGDNSRGQLGSGDTTSSTVPVKVCAVGQTAPCTRFLDGVGALDAGDYHNLVTSRPSADVAIALKASPNPVAANGNLTYTVTVKNNGPSAAENVTFDDSLPAEGEFVSASSTQGSCVVPPTGSTDTVTCKLGVLGANRSRTATITVTVRANAGTTVTDTAKVTSTTEDPNRVNNSVTVRTRVG
ncbi:hypothetical protein ACFYU9_07345 [Streptomyces sp. NPDC004327]|uniref:RCC1 domain-containing protein n=1 Tax=unclassified Streptomyces TaxID=2593676 RepID=UPI00368B8C6C